MSIVDQLVQILLLLEKDGSNLSVVSEMQSPNSVFVIVDLVHLDTIDGQVGQVQCRNWYTVCCLAVDFRLVQLLVPVYRRTA